MERTARVWWNLIKLSPSVLYSLPLMVARVIKCLLDRMVLLTLLIIDFVHLLGHFVRLAHFMGEVVHFTNILRSHMGLDRA